MDLNGLASLGWREVLIIISIVLAIYIVLTFFRLQGLKRQDDSVDIAAMPANNGAAIAAYETVQEEQPVEPPPQKSDAKDKTWYEPPSNHNAIEEPRIEAVERELVLLKKDRKRLLVLEQELDQFRREVGGLRAEIMVLRESVAKTPRMVSPHYNDAMEMALQGLDADAISQHCGISRAEADLVAALARHKD